MEIPFKKPPAEHDQHVLFPTNVYDLLHDDHDCYVFSQIIDQIDTSSLEKSYSRVGQNAYHPKLLLKILIYAYSHGLFSSRKIERRCRQDLAYMYIAESNCPNFRVLSDFRKNNGVFFKETFINVVKIAKELKFLSLGHISLDGSKFKANTSKHRAMSYKNLKEQEKELTKEIEDCLKKAQAQDEEADRQLDNQSGYEIPDDLKNKKARLNKIKEAKKAIEKRERERHPDKKIDSKKQISFADHDANIMGKGSSYDYAFNAQISVEEKNQFIVGQHISQKANDKQEVERALEEVSQTAGELPEKISMDNGYHSGSNLKAIEDKELDAYVAIGREGKELPNLEDSDRKLVKADFKYAPEENCFICPKGKKLHLKSKRKNKEGRWFYQGTKKMCKECPLLARCTSSKDGTPRVVSSDGHELERQRMRQKMQKEESKNTYKRRKAIVEPVFGHIKNSGFRGFSLRGLKGVETEFSLICLCHNIKKLIKCLGQGGVCLELGNTG